MRNGEFEGEALRAVRIEAQTNLIFRSKKWGCVARSRARRVLKLLLQGSMTTYTATAPTGGLSDGANSFALPRKQARVTWPIVTVSPCAVGYDFSFPYESLPGWRTYADFMTVSALVRKDIQRSTSARHD